MLKKYKLSLFLFTTLTTSAFAEVPCDYKVNDTIIYKGSIESVRFISKSIEEISNIKDIKKCVISIESRVDGKWYPSKGYYMYGPDMSETKACNLAEDRAKKKVMREQIAETLTSKKNLKYALTNIRKGCKVITMNTNIGKVKFMESCEK